MERELAITILHFITGIGDRLGKVTGNVRQYLGRVILQLKSISWSCTNLWNNIDIKGWLVIPQHD